MHNKIILIDGKVLFTGSHDLSKSAGGKGEENVLMFIDNEEIEGDIEEKVIKIYQERLGYLWEFNEP